MALQDIDAGFRLSPEQNRLWRLMRSGGTYSAQSHWRIEGELDEAALRQAVREVVARHEVLRSRFIERPGLDTALQVIADRDEPRWRRIGLPPHGGEDGLLEVIARDDQTEPFDLQDGPLLRATLADAGNGRSHLLLTLPALAADVTTLGNLATEVGYAYLRRSPERVRRNEPLQFADVAEALHDLFDGHDAAAGQRFWKSFLPTHARDVRMLFERPRPRETVFTPHEHPFELSVRRVEGIVSRARELGVSADVLVLACWRILLCRFSRQWDLPIGVGFDNRYCDELHGVLGPLAKYLPLSRPLDKAKRLGETVREIARDLHEFREWQELYRPAADGEAPLFLPHLFEGHPVPAPVDLGAAYLVPMAQRADGDRFKLKLCWTSRRGSLAVVLGYDSTVISSDDARRIEAAFDALTEHACANPEARIDDLHIDRLQIAPCRAELPCIGLERFNVARLFEDMARRFPDRPAIVCGRQTWTHAALDGRANDLACILLRSGLAGNEIVALCVDRSADLIVGLLGILKAGGAYLPLDPETPVQRVRDLLEEAGVVRVVTTGDWTDLFVGHATEVIRLDEAGAVAEPMPEVAAHPLSLAYVIYTSGSTGRPKAVAITHQGLGNYALAIRELLGLDRGDGESGLTFAAVSTPAADLGNTSIFVSLISGGCLHLIERDIVTGAGAFAAYVADHQIDVLKIVPSHFTALAAGVGEVAPRRFLILGGEVFSLALRELLAEAAATVEVINHYGPTEATVGATTFPLRGADLELLMLADSVPIGRPIARTQALALDDRLGPVPVGVPGELLIGGPGLARGYLGRPGETAERFVPHPYSAAPGARLYRTGDHVRYLPGYQLEILGRIDQQVKIRGFRVEPGEVAARLNAHPGVRQAVVVAHDAPPAAIRLVAYWVPAQDEPTVDALRRFLRATLPEFMVPASFVALDALPLTPNGKVDRRRLPAPDVARRHGERPFVAPRNSTEAMLADLWAEVLGVERIGVHDNFFELGGDSVYGIQIAARANQTGRLELSPMAIFRHPTIAELAAIAATARVPQSVDQAFAPAAEEVLRRISGQVGRAED